MTFGINFPHIESLYGVIVSCLNSRATEGVRWCILRRQKSYFIYKQCVSMWYKFVVLVRLPSDGRQGFVTRIVAWGPWDYSILQCFKEFLLQKSMHLSLETVFSTVCICTWLGFSLKCSLRPFFPSVALHLLRNNQSREGFSRDCSVSWHILVNDCFATYIGFEGVLQTNVVALSCITVLANGNIFIRDWNDNANASEGKQYLSYEPMEVIIRTMQRRFVCLTSQRYLPYSDGWTWNRLSGIFVTCCW